jgi:hypothetical protein
MESAAHVTNRLSSVDSFVLLRLKGVMVPQSVPEPEWPTHFPPDCPEASLPETSGPIFHFVRGKDTDYQTMWQRDLALTAAPCERVALSCFVRLEDAVQTRDVMQAKFGDCKVAKADLSPQHGKIKPTPKKGNPAHHSVWLRAPYEYAKLFQVIE